MKPKSKTDWARVRAVPESAPIPYEAGDGPYDPNDAKAAAGYLTAARKRRPGQRGPQKSPTKERITIRLSPEVVEHFRSTGSGWQAEMDEVLKHWVKRHPKDE